MLKNKLCIDYDTQLEIISQISENLYVMHKNKMVHQNIKASNILISHSEDRTLNCKLADPY